MTGLSREHVTIPAPPDHSGEPGAFRFTRSRSKQSGGGISSPTA